jgi:hypothetical protein
VSKRRVKWGQAKRFFERAGYTIRTKGGDRIIVAPSDGSGRRTRQTVRIGHRYSTRAGDELLPAHLSAIRRAFGVRAEDILGEG